MLQRVMERTERWHEGDPRLTNGALVVLGLALLVLTHQFVAEMSQFAIGFDGCSMLSSLVYLGAVLLVRTQPVDRTTLRIVLLFAVGLYAIPFLADPDRMSSDIYRYVWDGMVQHHWINPYRYVPGDPALASLRAPNQDVFDNINRRDYARTIYPPVAQMVYWLAAWFAPTVAAMKMVMIGFIGLTAWAVVRLLEALRRPASDVLLLLWCPLLIWEIGTAGHVDAAVCGFVALALLFRLRNRPVLTGLFLGAAVMTKFYPLVLLPALYQRRDWKMPATVLAVIAAGYAVYIKVGWLVLGFMGGGYQKEEGMNSGTRYFLLDWVQRLPGLGGVPKGAFLAFAALVLGAICLWAWRYATTERFEQTSHGVTVDGASGASAPLPAPVFLRASAMLAFAMMLLFSPHYAWYLAWLVPFMALTPSVPLFVYVLSFFYGFTTKYAAPGPTMYVLNEWIYGVSALALAVHLVMRRWPVWPRFVAMRQERMVLTSKPAGLPV